jgi:Domain of unknown function (DUF4192)
MSPAPIRLPIRGPGSLIAVVPQLFGFHPADSVVLVGLTGPHALMRLVCRYQLPDPPDTSITERIADHAASRFHRQWVTTAAVIGYGSGPLVTPVTDVLRHRLPRAGLRLLDVLRVEDGRYWSDLCTEPSCCPPQGRPLSTGDPAAAALVGFRLAAAASSDDLAATIAAVTGAEAEEMERATLRAARVIAQELDELGEDATYDALRRAVQDAIISYRDGGTISDPYLLSRISLALRASEIRDDAWARMTPEHRVAHLRLWTDLTRHATPRRVAAPAALLAFVAWQDGNSALAGLAIDRALDDQPDYTMAQIIKQALSADLPPSLAVITVTPEEVADIYRKGNQVQ